MTAVDLNKQIVFQPRGHRFDLETADRLKQQLAKIRSDRYPVLVVDMTHVEFIDSPGLGTLVMGLKTARQQGCRLVICNLQPSVRLIFEISQLDRAFEIVDSLDAVLSQEVKLAA
ncbi:MAG: STAS domain-containing protein [Okeania sp. SIO2H7]|nr:STAS domain-containing protein [Okeania sp. SIO2H7]